MPLIASFKVQGHGLSVFRYPETILTEEKDSAGSARYYPQKLPRWTGEQRTVIRVSLGKLSVNQLQVVKRTNTPLKSLTNGVVDRLGVFWVVGSSPTSTIINFFRLSPCRTWKILSPVCPGKETAWILTGPPYIRPTCYPAVSGGESVIRLSLGKLSVNQLQVV